MLDMDAKAMIQLDSVIQQLTALQMALRANASPPLTDEIAAQIADFAGLGKASICKSARQ